MNTRSGWIRGSLLLAMVVGLLAVSEADARGARGGRGGGGGRAARAPRVAAPRRANQMPAPRAPRMPRAAAPARGNAARANNAQARSNKTPTHSNHAATSAAGNTTRANSPNTYTYGSGTGARGYRAYGYGRGYRNRYYGGRRGYGRSQGNNRAIVSRLRSVHASLARINHDYRGHRVRAMHSISMAIRQLTHRSMVYRGAGFAPGGNNGLAMGMGMRRGGVGVGAGARGQRPMSQAQSDARMGQALRTTQGIAMQLTNQGYQTGGHVRARGHVRRAIREMNTALSIR